jgi:hypothetical protein
MIRFSGRRMWLAAALVLLAGAVSVEAVQMQTVNPVGRPRGFQAGATARFGVWNDGQGWHIHTTTAERRRRFQGSVEVIGGRFTSVTPQRLEETGHARDFWGLDPSRRILTIDFTTMGGTDGILFQVSPRSTGLRFDLSVDGRGDPQLIHIGRNATRPATSRFTLPAFPR